MSERIILKGRTETLKPIITEILAIHQLLRNRDIGEFVGHTVNEYVRSQPKKLKLKILFYSVQSPPWRNANGADIVRATYNVPFVRRSSINWTTIKTACGGANGYSWGRFRATANIIDNQDSLSQMAVYGGSENEAIQRLRALAALSEGSLSSLSVTEEKKEGRRATDKLLYKQTTTVYPAYFTIVNQEKIVTESNVALLTGNYQRAKSRIPLWTETKPPDADELITEALRVRGSTPGS